MEQFRHIGEVVGSLKALMVLKHDILINQRQCSLLFDMYVLAFETISDEIRQNLKLDERSIKWKALECPMKELHKVIKEGELYIKYCLDIKDWWGKAMTLHSNRDCVEFHVHNLLVCFPIVFEAIELAAEISGLDEEIMLKRRAALMKKYDTEWDDANLFQWMLGKQFLLPREISVRLNRAWKEDRWALLETITEKRNSAGSLAKHELRLADLLTNRLNGVSGPTKLYPSSVLIGASDYNVKRRLGSGQSHIKEIQWLGENFALKTFYGEIEPLLPEISLVLSLSHPNTLQYFSGFYDEDRKEGFLVMELMNKNLDVHIKESCGPKKRLPFSLPIAVDIMLQIARGMEYLHSKNVFHGDLNPSHVLLKPRNSSPEGSFHAKVTGFGLTNIKYFTYRSTPKQKVDDPYIWYAPEVLAEQEDKGLDGKCTTKYTEKADVYSFGMLCFQLLTGKIPFEDSHLQGEKTIRNIRAGERPLFPFPSTKYLANLTRKCWQSDPSLRPSFSSICRILRYIKKVLIINPDHGLPEAPPPLVDYCDIESGYAKKFPEEERNEPPPVEQIPFQLFVYRQIQKEKLYEYSKEKMWDMDNRGESLCDDDMDDLFPVPSDRRSFCSEIIERKITALAADQRSSCSEMPSRRQFASDQRSTCSESPMAQFRSLGLITPERNFPFAKKTTSRTSSFSKTPEWNFSSTRGNAGPISPLPMTPERRFANQNSYLPQTPERKILSEKKKHVEIELPKNETLSDQKIIETKPLTPTTEKTETSQKISSTTEQKPVKKQSLVRKISSRILKNKKLSDIPETSTSTIKKKSTSSEKSEKKTSKISKSVVKTPKQSEKTEPLNDFSPRNSPARFIRGSSSTARGSPSASPAASPSRLFKSSPRYSSNPRQYSSPVASPLNPCTRCVREPRETHLHL